MTRLQHETGFLFTFSRFVAETCRPGTGAGSCRYLTGDLGGELGLRCARLEPVLATVIDQRVADGTFVARGVNCAGRDIGERL